MGNLKRGISMRKSHVDEKVLNYKINNMGMAIIFKDMGEERRLEMMSKYNQFEDKNDKLKKLVLEIANTYFKNGITYQEFMENILKDYPEYEDNYTFNVLLGQYYRKLYSKSLREKELLKKLALSYQKRHK